MKGRWSLVLIAVLLAFGASSAFAKGKPVEPGNAKSEQFASATGCGCHAGLVDEWAASMHAQALTDPIYLAKLEEAQEATDGKLGAFCNKCHGPIATMTGEMASGELSEVSSQSITCSFCHQIVGLEGKPANTNQLVETDGVRRAQLENPAAPHPAAFSEFHKSAELCGGCHNVDHPVNGMHLEATYTEWKESPYAKDGIVCQECHMSAEPGTIGPMVGQAAGGAPERDNIYRMTFVGGQVALGPSDLARARLRSAATLELETAEILEPGEKTDVSVKITNSGAGHYLPTGLTEVRQMWLEVYSENEAGERTPIGERRFGTVLKDDEGNAPVELWEATGIESDDRIPPKESVEEKYSFQMPDGAERAKVVAALYYKSAPDELAQKAKVENPTTTMASANSVLYASEAARNKATEESVEALDDDDQSDTGASDWLVPGLVFAGVLAAIAGFAVGRRRKA